MDETSFAQLPHTFYVDLLRCLGRLECLSLFAVAARSNECKTLLEVYTSHHFGQEVAADEETKTSEHVDVAYRSNPNSKNSLLNKQIEISSFICDRSRKLVNRKNTCSRRKAFSLQATINLPSCQSLMLHSLALEQIIDSASPHFYCFSCLLKVKRRPEFLERYIGQRMLYCSVCLTRDFMISERSLEEEHGVPRKLQRTKLRLHSFELYLEHDMQRTMLMKQLQLDSQNGPIIAFQRRRNGSTPHIWYWKDDIQRIKAMFNERAIVSKDTQTKRVRREADVKRKIDELSDVLAVHGYAIKRLTLEEVPAKRVKNFLPSAT